jgi:hypothetical protein
MSREMRVYYKPTCGAAVQHEIDRSVRLFSGHERPREADVIESNIRILDAAIDELGGENLSRAIRSRKRLGEQHAHTSGAVSREVGAL